MLCTSLAEQGRIIKRSATGVASSPEDIEKSICEFLAGFGRPVDSVGIAVPGILDADGEVAACDVLPKLEGWRPAERMARFGYRAHAVNDAEAGLWHARKLWPENSYGILVMIGTGIGMSFQGAEGIWRGARGWAGELGSIPISSNDKGDVRTLDQRASGAAIVASLGLSGEEIKRRLAAGDEYASTCVRTAGRHLGLGLASAINILNPEVLFVGGGTLDYEGYWQSALTALKDYTMPKLFEACRIERAPESPLIVALGAAEYARHRETSRTSGAL